MNVNLTLNIYPEGNLKKDKSYHLLRYIFKKYNKRIVNEILFPKIDIIMNEINELRYESN